jgi:hypothetical protein
MSDDLLPISVSTRSMDPVTTTAGQVQIDYDFAVQRGEDLRVRRTRGGATVTLEHGIDYTVQGVGQPGGGTVTLAEAALAGDVFAIDGLAVLDRQASVAVNGRFSATQIDSEFDRVLFRDQELRRDIADLEARAVRAPEAGGAAGEQLTALPGAAARAGMVLGFGDDGDVSLYSSQTSLIAMASATQDGLMSKGDKAWLDAVRTVSPLEPQFGAVGDGVTDDTAAVQAALDYLKANASIGVLQITAPHFIAPDGVSYVNGPALMISSPHPDVGLLISDTGSGKALFTFKGQATDDSAPPVISRVGFVKAGTTAGAGTAIDCSYDYVGPNKQGLIIEDCKIFRQASGSFLNGIRLFQCPQAQISGNWIEGTSGLTSSKYGAGIRAESWCNGLQILDNRSIRGFERGIYVTDDTTQTSYTASSGQTMFGPLPWAVSTGSDIHVTVDGTQYAYTSGTPAAGEFSVSGVGVTTPGSVTVTLGAAATAGQTVYVDYDFQSEGFLICNNKIQACEIGIECDIDQVEIAWRVALNAIDTRRAGIRLRNLRKAIIGFNAFFHSAQDRDHCDIMLLTTRQDRYGYGGDGATLQQSALQMVVVGNTSDRSQLMRLEITGITRGATTTIAFISVNTAIPYDGAAVIIGGVVGTTELNGNVYTLASVSYDTGTQTGTAELRNYETGAAIDSSGYGAWSSNGRVALYNRFLEVQAGNRVHAFANMVENRHVALHLWPDTDRVRWMNNSYTQLSAQPNGAEVINKSAGGNLTIRAVGRVDLSDIDNFSGIGRSVLLGGSDLGNAVDNGNFEQGASGWTLDAEWSVVSNDAANAETGYSYLVNTNTGGQPRNFQSAAYQAVRPGEWVFCEVRWKSSASLTVTVNRARIWWYDKDLAQISVSNGASVTSASTTYGSLTVEAQAPANAVYFRVGGQVDGKTVGTIYVDNVVAYRKRDLFNIASSFGYVAGRGLGGTVTQATSKSTGVTLSTYSGQITMHNASLAANAEVQFTLTNTLIAATDQLVISHASAGTYGAYFVQARCNAGTATISVRNLTAGALGEAIVLGFTLIKGATT